MRPSILAPWALSVAILGGACAPQQPPAAAPPTTVELAAPSAAPAPPPPRAAEVAAPAPLAIGESTGLPVGPEDPSSGNADALVTIVEFGDFQCPFCARASATLGELRRRYADAELRIVWKNNPLPFHPNALPAAEAAQAVFEARGADAFWRYHDALFADQRALDEASLERLAGEVGVSATELAGLRSRGTGARKVRRDLDVAKQVGAVGTPYFYANGVQLSGAQPIERFVELVDAQLVRAKAAIARGVPRDRLYVALSSESLAEEKAKAKTKADSVKPVDEPNDPQVVPIAGAPVLGPPTALVTIVEYGDFQCPFCARAQSTLREVKKRFGNKVRIVWRNQPLPFHQRAEPMAEVAMEAFALRGNVGFWKLHDALWDAASSPDKITDQGLVALGVAQGLPAAKLKAAIATKKHAKQIEADQAYAGKIGARGTPTFFINGRKLVGAQPIEKFDELITEELRKAEALVAGGVPAKSVYDELQKTAKPPAP